VRAQQLQVWQTYHVSELLQWVFNDDFGVAWSQVQLALCVENVESLCLQLAVFKHELNAGLTSKVVFSLWNIVLHTFQFFRNFVFLLFAALNFGAAFVVRPENASSGTLRLGIEPYVLRLEGQALKSFLSLPAWLAGIVLPQ